MLFVAATTGKTAAMDVHQNGQFIAFLGGLGSEDVQKQAILVIGVSLAFAELVVVEVFLFVQLFVIECPRLIGAVGMVMPSSARYLPILLVDLSSKVSWPKSLWSQSALISSHLA